MNAFDYEIDLNSIYLHCECKFQPTRKRKHTKHKFWLLIICVGITAPVVSKIDIYKRNIHRSLFLFI